MTTIDHTNANLFAVALAGEESYWLCEPASARSLPPHWKSTPCRWLYPVNVSLDRFTMMSGFDITDSVFELGMEGVSRVEKYATLACDVKAKRQKLNGTTYFFVPQQEICRVNERYKQLLKREEQERQHRLEEKEERLESHSLPILPESGNVNNVLLKQGNSKETSNQFDNQSGNEYTNMNNINNNNNDHIEVNRSLPLRPSQSRNKEFKSLEQSNTIGKSVSREHCEEGNNSINIAKEEIEMKDKVVRSNVDVPLSKEQTEKLEEEWEQQEQQQEEKRNISRNRRRRRRVKSQKTSANTSHLHEAHLDATKQTQVENSKDVGSASSVIDNPFTWREHYILHRQGGNIYLCKNEKGNEYGYRLTKYVHNFFTIYMFFGNELNKHYIINTSEIGVLSKSSAILECDNKSCNTKRNGGNKPENNLCNSVLVLTSQSESSCEKRKRSTTTTTTIKENLSNEHDTNGDNYALLTSYKKKESFESEEESSEEWSEHESQAEEEREKNEFSQTENLSSTHLREVKKLNRVSRQKSVNESKISELSNNNNRNNNRLSRKSKRVKTENRLSDHEQADINVKLKEKDKKTTMEQEKHKNGESRTFYDSQDKQINSVTTLETVGVNLWSDAVEPAPAVAQMVKQHPFVHDPTHTFRTAVFADGTCVTYTPASSERVLTQCEQTTPLPRGNVTVNDYYKVEASSNTDVGAHDTINEHGNNIADDGDNKKLVDVNRSMESSSANNKLNVTTQSNIQDDDMRVLLDNIKLAKEQINIDV